MPYFVDDPRRWRDRAQEARALADAITDHIAKAKMLEVADAYDRIAERAEQRAKDLGTPENSN